MIVKEEASRKSERLRRNRGKLPKKEILHEKEKGFLKNSEKEFHFLSLNIYVLVFVRKLALLIIVKVLNFVACHVVKLLSHVHIFIFIKNF